MGWRDNIKEDCKEHGCNFKAVKNLYTLMNSLEQKYKYRDNDKNKASFLHGAGNTFNDVKRQKYDKGLPSGNILWMYAITTDKERKYLIELLNNVFEINQMLYKYGIHYNYDEIDDDFNYDILTEEQYSYLTAISRRKSHKEEFIKKTYNNEINNIKKRINEIINDKENMNVLKGELTDISQSLIFEKCDKMNAFKETLLYFQQLKNKTEREKNGIKDRAKSYRNIKKMNSKNGKRNKTAKFNRLE
jgi:hypothetical protein